jgi:hypothetical protein
MPVVTERRTSCPIYLSLGSFGPADVDRMRRPALRRGRLAAEGARIRTLDGVRRAADLLEGLAR